MPARREDRAGTDFSGGHAICHVVPGFVFTESTSSDTDVSTSIPD
jgi:hypothetical protein